MLTEDEWYELTEALDRIAANKIEQFIEVNCSKCIYMSKSWPRDHNCEGCDKWRNYLND